MKTDKEAVSFNFINTDFRIDRKLFKYYSNTEHAIDCIKNRRIHLDSPLSFNDPFDAAFSCPPVSQLPAYDSEQVMAKDFIRLILTLPKHLQGNHHLLITAAIDSYLDSHNTLFFSGSNKTVGQPVKEIIEKLFVVLNSNSFTIDDLTTEIDAGYIEEHRVKHLKCKISCFSEICDSILMWSYYANCHKGLCLEFDLSKLNNTSPLNASIINNIKRVNYSPLRADVQYSSLPKSELNFLISKADVWQHEHEWRLICDTDEDYLPFDCLSHVYIGVNFSMDNSKNGKYSKLIRAVNSHSGVPISRCKLSANKFQIEFEGLYNSIIPHLVEKDESMDSINSFAG